MGVGVVVCGGVIDRLTGMKLNALCGCVRLHTVGALLLSPHMLRAPTPPPPPLLPHKGAPFVPPLSLHTRCPGAVQGALPSMPCPGSMHSLTHTLPAWFPLYVYMRACVQLLNRQADVSHALQLLEDLTFNKDTKARAGLRAGQCTCRMMYVRLAWVRGRAGPGEATGCPCADCLGTAVMVLQAHLMPAATRRGACNLHVSATLCGL